MSENVMPLKKIRGMEVSVRAEEREKIHERIEVCLAKGWLMWGDEQAEFMNRWKDYTGRPFVTTLNSASSGLDLLFQYLAAKSTKRLRICFQANAFPSPIFMAKRAGLEVVFTDIDIATMAPTKAELDAAWEGQAGAFDILALQHTGGFITEHLAAIQAWCQGRGVQLLEDASHAAGSALGGKPAGSFGTWSCFSLASTKALHTGQGGILLCDDQELATYLFQGKNYGRTEMFQKGQYVQVGGNNHLTEMQAAMGNVLFQSMPGRIAERAGFAEVYAETCAKLGLMPLGSQATGAAPNYYKYPVLLPAGASPVALKAFMADAQIELGSAMYDFIAPYLEVVASGHKPGDFPKAEMYTAQHVCLPMHNSLTTDDVVRVCERLTAFIGG